MVINSLGLRPRLFADHHASEAGSLNNFAKVRAIFAYGDFRIICPELVAGDQRSASWFAFAAVIKLRAFQSLSSQGVDVGCLDLAAMASDDQVQSVTIHGFSFRRDCQHGEFTKVHSAVL